VPFVAMGYEMSDDFHERTSIMAISQWIGQWAWVIAPWFWVIMYDPSWFPNADTATRTLAIWVGVIFMFLAMVPAIFIKSKSTKFDDNLEPLTFRTIGGSMKEILVSFKEAFVNRPFRKLCIATFLMLLIRLLDSPFLLSFIIFSMEILALQEYGQRFLVVWVH
jgi:GPH family glycoside/pentoside/hexuronide:cation symporter